MEIPTAEEASADDEPVIDYALVALAKRVRALRKKLRQTSLLQERDEAGEPLDDDERAKLGRRDAGAAQLAESEEELRALQLARANEEGPASLDEMMAASSAAESGSRPAKPAAKKVAAAAAPSLGAWAAAGAYGCREIDAHYDAVSSLWWEGSLLVSGSWDSSVKLIDLDATNAADESEREVVRSWGGHTGRVRAVSVLRGSAGNSQSLVVSGSSDCSIRLWGLRSGFVDRIYVYAPLLALDARDGLVLTGLTDATVKLWSVERLCLQSKLGAHSAAVSAARWLDEKTAVSASADGTAALWDTRSGGGKPAATFGEENGPALLSVCADGAESAARLLTSDATGCVTLYDVRQPSAALRSVLAVPDEPGCTARALSLSAEYAVAAGGRPGNRGFVSVIDLKQGVVERVAGGEYPAFGSACVSGSKAVLGGRDGKVWLWDADAEAAEAEAEAEGGDPPKPSSPRRTSTMPSVVHATRPPPPPPPPPRGARTASRQKPAEAAAAGGGRGEEPSAAPRRWGRWVLGATIAATAAAAVVAAAAAAGMGMGGGEVAAAAAAAAGMGMGGGEVAAAAAAAAGGPRAEGEAQAA